VGDGAVVDIAANAKLEKPVLIVSVRASHDAQLLVTRNVISVGDNAEATIIEAFVATPKAAKDTQLNAATKIVVGKAAAVSHVKCAWVPVSGAQLSNWLVDLDADADYRGFHFTAGTALARNQIGVVFTGPGGKIDLSGVFLGRGGDHIDTTMVVDHAVPGCTSRELFKGVLDDHARGVFQGKVIVRPHAQKTDGKQSSHALLLSEGAEFDAKPELEIYADDVICGHGATSGELDETQLFYLNSRGIPEVEAKSLLIAAFVGESFDTVNNEAIRDELIRMTGEWLSGRSRA
jgi:Fe-S cluster assembly protein SufD